MFYQLWKFLKVSSCFFHFSVHVVIAFAHNWLFLSLFSFFEISPRDSSSLSSFPFFFNVKMTKSLFFILLPLLWLTNGTNGSGGGKILVGYAPDSKSHLRSIQPLITRLAHAGHQITVFYATSDEQPMDFGHGNNVSTIYAKMNKPDETKMSVFGEMIWRWFLNFKFKSICYYFSGIQCTHICLRCSIGCLVICLGI